MLRIYTHRVAIRRSDLQKIKANSTVTREADTTILSEIVKTYCMRVLYGKYKPDRAKAMHAHPSTGAPDMEVDVVMMRKECRTLLIPACEQLAMSIDDLVRLALYDVSHRVTL